MNFNIASLMKQAQKAQAEIAQIQQEMGERRVEATAGGGMVTAVANGRGELVSIRDKQVIWVLIVTQRKIIIPVTFKINPGNRRRETRIE